MSKETLTTKEIDAFEEMALGMFGTPDYATKFLVICDMARQLAKLEKDLEKILDRQGGKI